MIRLYSIRIALSLVLISSVSLAQLSLVDLTKLMSEIKSEDANGVYANLKLAKILALHPTQPTSGDFEVAYKGRILPKLSNKKLEAYLKTRVVPVVLAPDGNLYLIDHHHFAKTMAQLGVEQVLVNVIADYSKLEDMDAFWKELEARKWVYLFDKKGNPIPPEMLPKTVLGLINDYLRSLAYVVRISGGYEETEVPFSEFYWAKFLKSYFDLSDEEWKKFFEDLLEISEDKEKLITVDL